MISSPIDEAYRLFSKNFQGRNIRPLVGITGNFGEKGCELAEGYFRSIELAGATPMVIPPTDDVEAMTACLELVDGLLLSGGADINPLLLGEDPIPQLGGINAKRDKHELLLTRLAYQRNIPIFGICRGIQVICAALGGKLHQDIAACMPDAQLIKHSQTAARHVATHHVQAEKGSLIARLLGETFAVNSFHHQAVSECGPGFRATAHASDGVIEAIESSDHRSVFGVQWHPECFCLEGDNSMLPLFCHFVKECQAYRTARQAHREILTLDTHCDTPMLFERGIRLDERHPDSCVDFYKMCEGGLDAAIMVAYLPQGERTDADHNAATKRCDAILEEISRQVGRNEHAQLCDTPDALYDAKSKGKCAVMMGIENGYAIGRDLTNISRYRKQGVVYMTLCHNGDNDICDSARRSQQEHGGLSEFGRSVVAEMNRCGMMIDLSHASEDTFYDVLKQSQQPVVCSHSSARALCNHPRNVSDDQIRAIAAQGGVVQVTFYNGFLRETGEASIIDAVQHILHVIKVGGIDAVGIGSDFDGDGGVSGLRNASDHILLTRALQAEGLTTEQLKKVWGENFLRVMRCVQQSRCV